MARVIYGGVGLQGLSGSINKQAGGHTFTRNNVVRRRVVGTNPQSSAQVEVRLAFNYFNTQWAALLTDQQREAWNEAKTDPYWFVTDQLNGVQRQMNSGKALFVATNMSLAVANDSLNDPGINLITAVPLPNTQDDTAFTSIAIDASAQTVAFAYSGTASNEALLVRMTPPVSPGNTSLKSVKSKLRDISVGTGASPQALGTAYTDIFGALTGQAGKKVFFTVEAISMTTGKRRLLVADSVLIVA